MKVKWPKKAWYRITAGALQDAMYGHALLYVTRMKKQLKNRPCPPKEEVLEIFARWLSKTADEAVEKGEVTREMLKSREEAYKEMGPRCLIVCSDWVVHKGSGSIAEIVEEELRERIKARGAEIVS